MTDRVVDGRHPGVVHWNGKRPKGCMLLVRRLDAGGQRLDGQSESDRWQERRGVSGEIREGSNLLEPT